MRARRITTITFALALALVLGGAACGDDDSAGSGTTTTAALPTTEPVDLAEKVEEFCAKTDELQALFDSMVAATGEGASTTVTTGPADVGPTPTSTVELDPAQEARLQELGQEVGQLMVGLQTVVPQMLPGDAARFRECAAVMGGAPTLPTG